MHGSTDPYIDGCVSTDMEKRADAWIDGSVDELINAHTYTYTDREIGKSTHMCACVYIYIHICIYIYICMYVCMCVCIQIGKHIDRYVCPSLSICTLIYIHV